MLDKEASFGYIYSMLRTGARRPFACLPNVLAGWRALRARQPHVSILEAAFRLRISEAEVIAAVASAGAGRPIRCEPAAIMSALHALQPLTATTRNRYAVIESSDDFACEVNPAAWRFAFALRSPAREGDSRSIQIFGADGAAVHKAFTRSGSDPRVFDELVAALATCRKTWAPPVIEVIAPERAGTRERALRLAGPRVARPVTRLAHRRVVAQALELGLRLTCTVGNFGMVHALTMRVRRPVLTEPWYEVFGNDHALHLDESGIARAWIVRVSGADGIEERLELFDRRGMMVMQIRAGDSEGRAASAWRGLLSALP